MDWPTVAPPGVSVYIAVRCSACSRQMAPRRRPAVDRRRTAIQDTHRSSTKTRSPPQDILYWPYSSDRHRSSPPGEWTVNFQVRCSVPARWLKSGPRRATAVGADVAVDVADSSSTTVLRGTSASDRNTEEVPWCGSGMYSRLRRWQPEATYRQISTQSIYGSLLRRVAITLTQLPQWLNTCIVEAHSSQTRTSSMDALFG